MSDDYEVNQPSYVAIIPADVRYDPDLKANQKLLYGEITCLSNKYGICWARNKYFADLYGVTEVSISNWVNDLVRKGYIMVAHRKTQQGQERYIVLHTLSDSALKEKLAPALKENFNPALKEKFIWIYNNINQFNRTSIEGDTMYPSNAPVGAPVIDDIPTKKMTRTKEAPEPCDYVEHWNAQDCTSKHKDPGAKIYKEAARRCGQLENGILSRACVIDPAWADRNKVPVEMMRRKWTPDEIREGIRRLALVYKEGYWPHDKKKLPRSLSDMIYNPRSKSSWFLRVMANEPLPIADTAAPLDDAVHAMYRKLFKGKALTDAEETKLVRMVNLLVGKQREVARHLEPYLGHTSFSGKFGSRNNRFFQTHIDWLTGWCEDIRVETVWKTWGAFVRWARDFHKMEIEPSNDNVRHAKQAHRRADEERKRREESAERSRLSELAHLV